MAGLPCLSGFSGKKECRCSGAGVGAGASGSASAALAGHRHRLTRNADIGTSSFSSLNPAHAASVRPFDAGGIGLIKDVLLRCRSTARWLWRLCWRQIRRVGRDGRQPEADNGYWESMRHRFRLGDAICAFARLGTALAIFCRPAGWRKAPAGDRPDGSRACARSRPATARFPRTGIRSPCRCAD